MDHVLSELYTMTHPSWEALHGVDFLFFLVLPVYCYQPISLHPRAHMLSQVIPWISARQTPLSMDFSRQEYWSGLPFPSPNGVDYSFIELDKAVVHVSVWLVFCDCGFHSVCLLMEKDRGLQKLPDGRD